MANFLAPIINDQQEDSNGAPLSGGTIEVYLAGSSTPATTYSDQAGASPNTWPIVLNTLGVNSQGAVWLGGGFAYKFIIKDATGVVQRTIDNVQGINDSTSTLDQWVQFQTAPTYVSATSFTVAGDQRQIFQIRRRIKSTNTGGTIYSTVTNSAYVAPNTTVTVINDSGALDPGLSQVFYGIISPLNTSLPPGLLIGTVQFTATGVYNPTPGTQSVIVEMVGGGGGAAGSPPTGAGQVSLGGGGGGGSYAKGRFTSGFAGVTVTVGTGGIGGGISTAGSPGGTSSFGGLMTAPGGSGGPVGVASSVTGTSGGTGGVAGVGGNILQATGETPATVIAAFVDAAVFGVKGGSSLMGIGPAGPFTNTNAGGVSAPANAWGAGGSGPATFASQGGTSGGNGRQGIVIIYEYA